MTTLLSEEDITRHLSALPAWRRQGEEEIRADYQAPAFLDGIALVDAVAAEAERRDHHPDIDIRWRTVTFVLSTHSEGGLTENDFALAGIIATHAEQLGAVPRAAD